MADGDKLIPFVRQFHSPSPFWWEDEVGVTRKIQGGEQGDLLMPLLFSVEQHRALVQVQAGWRGGERLFAFLDDIYVVCPPERVDVYTSRWSTRCEQKQASASASIWGKQSCGMQKGENLVVPMPSLELHRKWCGEETSHCRHRSKV